MKRDRRWWGLVYGGCAAAVLLALGWISAVLLEVEEERRTQQARAEMQENLRLALWQMDSWLAPLLAQESARPYFEYLGYYPSQRAYNRILNPLDPSEVLTRSPPVPVV